MKERQIEAAYRARFDEQRRSTEAMNSLYTEASAGRDSDKRAWLVATAHPRVPAALARPRREDAREVFDEAGRVSLSSRPETACIRLRTVSYSISDRG